MRTDMYIVTEAQLAQLRAAAADYGFANADKPPIAVTVATRAKMDVALARCKSVPLHEAMRAGELKKLVDGRSGGSESGQE